VSVALIEGIVEVVTDDDNGNGNDGNGNGGHDGGGIIAPGTGGGENKRTVGERDLPPAVRGVHRSRYHHVCLGIAPD
jgi:hypothetical protein